MSDDQKEGLKAEISADLREQLLGIVGEIQKPGYKGLRVRLVNLFFTVLIFILVAAGSYYGWNKAQQFSALLETPRQITEAKQELATQMSAAKRESSDTFETKTDHYNDTKEIKAMVTKGESERAKIMNTLDDQSRQLTTVNAGLQSIQNAVNQRNLRN